MQVQFFQRKIERINRATSHVLYYPRIGYQYKQRRRETIDEQQNQNTNLVTYIGTAHHKAPVMRKASSYDDVIMQKVH